MSRKAWAARELAELARRYSEEDTAAIAADLNRTMSATYQRALKMGLRKSREFMQRVHGQRLRQSGKAHRFDPGQEPWNKGKKGWQAGGRSKQTQFKRGNRPHTWKPVGSERVNKDGVLMRKISDDRSNRSNRWRPVHVLMWEEAHGPVPDDHIIVFKDRDQRHLSLDNLMCITRAENMRRNSYLRYPHPIPDLIRLRGAVNRQINKRSHKHEKQD